MRQFAALAVYPCDCDPALPGGCSPGLISLRMRVYSNPKDSKLSAVTIHWLLLVTQQTESPTSHRTVDTFLTMEGLISYHIHNAQSQVIASRRTRLRPLSQTLKVCFEKNQKRQKIRTHALVHWISGTSTSY